MKFSRKYLNIPYIIFLLLFVIFPLLVIGYYAFTNGQGEWTISNFTAFFTNTKTLGTLFYSVIIAFTTTVVCLLIAYPAAYFLAKGPFRRSAVWVVLIVMPMWINFTLRITALKEVLSVLEGNLAYHPFFNTILCMTYDFLPFMIMPLYSSITKLDPQLWEAAQDLGARRWQVLWKIIIPLTMPGIISGVTMIFLPAMTNYVVLDMVYNSTYIMGSLIGSYFNAYDWNNGSMISVILLLFIFAVYAVSSRAAGQQTIQRGGSAL